MKDIDIILDLKEPWQLLLAEKMLDAEVTGEDFFNVYPHTMPTLDGIIQLEQFYAGMIDGRSFGTYPNNGTEKEEPLGLKLIQKCAKIDLDDAEARPNADHLVIVFANKTGGTPHFVKRKLPIHGPERRNKKTGAVKRAKFIWVPMHKKRVIVLNFDFPPVDNVLGQYQRVWVSNEKVIKSVSEKCTRCKKGVRMFTKGYKTMVCKQCGHESKSQKVVWIGKKFELLSPIDEYEIIFPDGLPPHMR